MQCLKAAGSSFPFLKKNVFFGRRIFWNECQHHADMKTIGHLAAPDFPTQPHHPFIADRNLPPQHSPPHTTPHSSTRPQGADEAGQDAPLLDHVHQLLHAGGHPRLLLSVLRDELRVGWPRNGQDEVVVDCGWCEWTQHKKINCIA